MSDDRWVGSILRRLVSIPSLSGREAEIQEYIESILEDLGYSFYRGYVTPTSYNIYVEIGRGGKTILLEAHVDTIDLYDFKSGFKPIEIDGKIYGRGAADDKASVATLILLLKMLSNVDPSYRVRLVFAVDEEFSGRGAYDIVARRLAGDINVILEPTSLHLCNSASGCIEYQLVFEGMSGHGSIHRDNVAVKAMDLLLRLYRDKRFWLEGEKPFEREHLNIGVVESGVGGWITPPSFKTHILHHYLPRRSYEEVYSLHLESVSSLARKLGLKRWEMEVLHSAPAFQSRVSESAEKLLNILREMGLPGEWGHMPSESDANFIASFTGKPTYVFGPGDLEVAHSRREYVAISDIVSASRALYKWLTS